LICVALVVFVSWRPGKALLVTLLFAFFDAPVLVARKASYPQALTKPYRKGERQCWICW
jgi:simple sugar transport system permease protein